MVLLNHAARQMAAKIVYYGPGLCGKTTNLKTIHRQMAATGRGELVSVSEDTNRTLFLDLLSMDMGEVWGLDTRLQLYTVPGQVFYDGTRKLVLQGVDGIVFVADSQARMLEANKESLANLEAHLLELGRDLGEMPLVFQWNKRDLSDLLSVETLERELNLFGKPSFCAIAREGTGVFETLKSISRGTLIHVKQRHFPQPGRREEPLPKRIPPRRVLVAMPPLLVKVGPSRDRPAAPHIVLPKLAPAPKRADVEETRVKTSVPGKARRS